MYEFNERRIYHDYSRKCIYYRNLCFVLSYNSLSLQQSLHVTVYYNAPNNMDLTETRILIIIFNFNRRSPDPIVHRHNS
nr:hypothetical protein Itr_chr05CG21680 [Ipomoea trifida]